MSVFLYALAVVIGIVTGGITSLIGASGVMVIVPVLTMLFHTSAHTAIGTSLFVDVIASLTVSWAYYKNGNIDIKSGVWIAVASIAGAQLGSLFASQMHEGTLSAAFGVVLLLAGAALLLRSRRTAGDAPPAPRRGVHFAREWQRVVTAVGIGVGIGVASGLFGAGGGVMILLALVLILSFPLHKAIGTSTLIMAVTALSSTIGYAARGYLDVLLGCLLSAGAVIGGTLGGRYANRIDERALQRAVSVCFMGLGVVMTVLQATG